MKIGIAMTVIAAALAAPAMADPVVSTYEDLDEGFYGVEFHHNGVTYKDVNSQPGVFPDGTTFEGGDGVEGLGTEIIVENAGLLYDDFPDYGSPTNALTFGTSLVPGENLTVGALSTVTMELDQVSDFASLELAYYEHGPWGGIVYHLDALMGGQVVASDSFEIASQDGRDSIAFRTMSVDGAQFDSLHLYATFGDDYSGPRGMIDNLTINPIPAPASVMALAGLAGFVGRRRR